MVEADRNYLISLSLIAGGRTKERVILISVYNIYRCCNSGGVDPHHLYRRFKLRLSVKVEIMVGKFHAEPTQTHYSKICR